MELKTPALESGWSKSGSMAPHYQQGAACPRPAQAFQASLGCSAAADETVSSLTDQKWSRETVDTGNTTTLTGSLRF